MKARLPKPKDSAKLSRPKPIIDTIGEFVVSEIRLPYSDVIPELREKRTMFPGAPQKEFCAVKQGGYLKLAGMERCGACCGPQIWETQIWPPIRWSEIFESSYFSPTKRVLEKDHSPKLIPKLELLPLLGEIDGPIWQACCSVGYPEPST